MMQQSCPWKLQMIKLKVCTRELKWLLTSELFPIVTYKLVLCVSAGGLKAVGVTETAAVVQVGAVGTAVVLSIFLARKKSTFHRVCYPATAAVAVWTTFYMSSPSNREHTLSEMNRMWTRYNKSK